VVPASLAAVGVVLPLLPPRVAGDVVALAVTVATGGPLGAARAAPQTAAGTKREPGAAAPTPAAPLPSPPSTPGSAIADVAAMDVDNELPAAPPPPDLEHGRVLLDLLRPHRTALGPWYAVVAARVPVDARTKR
jgi:hypothetical protein